MVPQINLDKDPSNWDIHQGEDYVRSFGWNQILAYSTHIKAKWTMKHNQTVRHIEQKKHQNIIFYNVVNMKNGVAI